MTTKEADGGTTTQSRQASNTNSSSVSSGPTPKPQVRASPVPRAGKVSNGFLTRNVTYYSIEGGELTTLGLVQAGAAIFATVAWTYWESYKELSSQQMTVAIPSTKAVLQAATDDAWLNMIIFAAMAIIAFGLQGLQLSRIKAAHGVRTIWGALMYLLEKIKR